MNGWILVRFWERNSSFGLSVLNKTAIFNTEHQVSASRSHHHNQINVDTLVIGSAEFLNSSLASSIKRSFSGCIRHASVQSQSVNTMLMHRANYLFNCDCD